jgi:hypothetical protein
LSKCKVCKAEYTKRSTFQATCHKIECALEYVRRKNKKDHEQKIKEQRRKDKQWLEENKSKSELTKEAQKEFNKYIRLRDYFDDCISCGADRFSIEKEQGWKVGGAWDAGHFLSRGAHPNLRFNTYNAHKQCKTCNGGSGKFSHKEKTTTEKYRANLIDKIGESKVARLEEDNSIMKLDKDYLRRVRDVFRKRARLTKRRYGI